MRKPILRIAKLTLMLACVLCPAIASADVVELLSGAKIEGSVTKIDKVGRQVTFTRMLNGKPYTTTFPYSKIHAVTLGERRFVLTEKAGGDATASGKPGSSSGGSTDTGDNASRRTKAQVQALIEQQGAEPPEWYESTPLAYPDSLDLDWPEPPPQPWNNQKNVGQYVWDVINPNPSRWREGTKLMHHLLTVHKDNPATQKRIMTTLGRFYHDLLEDYPRAAFWWQKAGVHLVQGNHVQNGPRLAGCYFRMGNKEMAVELLNKLGNGSVSFGLIKAWGEVGEPRKAIEMADAFVRGRADTAAMAYMYAGDACRANGMTADAIKYYEMVLAQAAEGQLKGRIDREQRRARESLDAIRLFDQFDPTKVADGSYEASSQGYEAQIRVAVTVQSGRIEEVKVVDHREKQFYSAMTDTPTKILKKQHVKGIDTTASATLTSEAIINATAKAVAAAPKK